MDRKSEGYMRNHPDLGNTIEEVEKNTISESKAILEQLKGENDADVLLRFLQNKGDCNDLKNMLKERLCKLEKQTKNALADMARENLLRKRL